MTNTNPINFLLFILAAPFILLIFGIAYAMVWFNEMLFKLNEWLLNVIDDIIDKWQGLV